MAGFSRVTANVLPSKFKFKALIGAGRVYRLPSWVAGTVLDSAVTYGSEGTRWYWKSAPTVFISAENKPLVLFEAVERKTEREERFKSLGTLLKLIIYF